MTKNSPARYAPGFLRFLLLLLPLSSLSTTSSLLAANTLDITTDRLTAYYEVNELIRFNVRASAGSVSYELLYDKNTKVLATGTVEVQNGEAQITYTLSEPGVLLCRVTQNGLSAMAAAVVQPYDLKSLQAEPENFDAFWQAAKNQLAAVPIDPQLSFYSSDAYTTTYRINLATIQNRRVYGYISVPHGAGPFPAVLTLPPFGTLPSIVTPEHLMARDAGVIAMTISIHNAEPDVQDPTAYIPNSLTNPNENYYRQAVLDGIRAIDYIFSRNDFSGNLALMGVSQGAGLSLLTAGVDERVKFIAYSGASHCQHAGYKYNKASGFPFYLHQASQLHDTTFSEMTLLASQYFEAIHFARRFKGTVYTFINYLDDVSPAATQFAAFDELTGMKILMHSKNLGHVHPPEYWTGRYDYLRQLFPETQQTAVRWAPKTTGYFIDAGEAQAVSAGGSVNLQGTILKNGIAINLPVKWEKISGAGTVTFANVNAAATTATFDLPGTYRLRLSANDYSKLEQEGKYFTLVDEVTITVGAANFLSITCPQNLEISIPAGEDSVTVHWALPQVLSACTSSTESNLVQTAGPTNGSLLGAGVYTIFYRAENECGNSSLCSFTVTVIPTETVTEPCFPKGERPWWEWISGVELNSLHNLSYKEGYRFFNQPITPLSVGQTYPIRLKIGFSWFSYAENWWIAIDFNQNGIFEDSETVLNFTTPAPPHQTFVATFEQAISIPASARLGVTRMRIIMNREDITDRCASFQYGEVEDYAIDLRPFGQISSGGSDSTGNTTATTDVAATLVLSHLFPNPATDVLYYSIQSEKKTQGTIQIIDHLGRVLQQEIVSLQQGWNDRHIPIAQLQNGSYLFALQVEGQAPSQQRFMKIK